MILRLGGSCRLEPTGDFRATFILCDNILVLIFVNFDRIASSMQEADEKVLIGAALSLLTEEKDFLSLFSRFLERC